MSAQSNGLSAILLGAIKDSWVVKGSQVPLAGRVRVWPRCGTEEDCQRAEVVVGTEGLISIRTGSGPPHQGKELLQARSPLVLGTLHQNGWLGKHMEWPAGPSRSGCHGMA